MSLFFRRVTRLPLGAGSPIRAAYHHRPPVLLLRRHASSASRNPNRSSWRHLLRPLAGAGMLCAGGAVLLAPSSPSSSSTESNVDKQPSTSSSLARVPFSQLVRSYFVYSTLTLPFVVDYAPGLLEWLIKIPVVRSLTLFCVRHTFFAQFVGGESAEDLLPLMRELKQQNKASILTYNVEVDEAPGAEAQWRRNIEETKRSIEVMGRYAGEGGIVAIKLTALVPHASALENISQYLLTHRTSHTEVPYPGTPTQTDIDVLRATGSALTLPPPPERDIAEIREMYQSAREIARSAKEYGIKLLIDAEHTWYQPVVDAITLALSEEFNTSPSTSSGKKRRSWLDFSAPEPPKAVVYGTYQSYLRRNPSHVRAQLELAKSGGYALGVKLVRGAYHPHELAHAQRTHIPPPVFSEKKETDECYNSIVRLLLADIAAKGGKSGTAVVFGTHNRESVEVILRGLVEEGLALREEGEGGRVRIRRDVEGRVAVAQLYGMHDDLTDYVADRLVASSPVATKCIPYGSIDEVMPYLARRAIENKSVLGGQGGAAQEMRRYGAEIWRRIRGMSAL